MTLEAWVNPSTVSSAWRDVIYKGNDNYYLEGTSPTSEPAGDGGHVQRESALWDGGVDGEHVDAPGGDV